MSNEYKKYAEYKSRARGNRYSSPAEKAYDADNKSAIDNYIEQRREMKEKIQEREQIILNKKDIPTFVNEMAVDMNKELVKVFKEVGLI